MPAIVEKIDLKKLMKPYWQPSADRFQIVQVPKLNFCKIDGEGDPNSAEAYQHAVKWLFSLSYALKFMSKGDLAMDYGVAPLEGLWWAEDMAAFIQSDKSNWLWTAMIMQPDWISEPMFAKAVKATSEKLGPPPQSLRFEPFEEGLSVQIMHIGPYADEAPTIAKLHDMFLPANKLVATGHHHEIYIGDPRRSAPDKLKTVIRQPVRRA